MQWKRSASLNSFRKWIAEEQHKHNTHKTDLENVHATANAGVWCIFSNISRIRINFLLTSFVWTTNRCRSAIIGIWKFLICLLLWGRQTNEWKGSYLKISYFTPNIHPFHHLSVHWTIMDTFPNKIHIFDACACFHCTTYTTVIIAYG